MQRSSSPSAPGYHAISCLPITQADLDRGLSPDQRAGLLAVCAPSVLAQTCPSLVESALCPASEQTQQHPTTEIEDKTRAQQTA